MIPGNDVLVRFWPEEIFKTCYQYLILTVSEQFATITTDEIVELCSNDLPLVPNAFRYDSVGTQNSSFRQHSGRHSNRNIIISSSNNSISKS